MTIQHLIDLANQCLQRVESSRADSLRNRVIKAHTLSVTRKLLTILEKTETGNVLERLENLLKHNWQDTKQTMLGYTTRPESDMTRLLIKTAEFVAQSRNNHQKLVDTLKRPVGVIGLLISKATKLVGLSDNVPQYPVNAPKRPVNVIELLMPGVATESLHDAYPDLDDCDVQTLLMSHVLGSAGSYLIPVKLLTELQANAHIQFINPYFDFQRHTDNQASINQEELERLYHHAPETRALKEAYDTYKTITADKISLFDNLMYFCEKLHLNSVDMQGEEDNAAKGAYPAIIAFNDYYASLTDDDKALIPQKLSHEIDKLLTLSSDKGQNTNATANLETCLATRRSDLLAAIKGQESILQNIAVTDAHRKKLANAAKKLFEQCQHELKMSIEQGNYRGHDSFGLNRRLLKRLKIKMSVLSLADLHEFLNLTTDEITELSQTEALKKQITRQVKALDEWVILALDTPLPKLEALMAQIGERLANKLIKKPADVSALLMPLTSDRINTVLGAINNTLPSIIRDGEHFRQLLQHLTSAQRTSVCTAMKEKLPDIMQNGWDFGRTLEELSPEQRIKVYSAMKNRLSGIIKDGLDFGLALQYLTPGQCAGVCAAMKNTLPGILKNGAELGWALQYLTPAQCTSVCSAIKDKLPEIIQNASELKSFLECTNAQSQQHFFASGSANHLLAKIILHTSLDMTECHKIIHSGHVKNEFNKALFSGLLLELKQFIQNMPVNHAFARVKLELERLTETSAQYFNAYPHNGSQLTIFQRNCRSDINAIKTKLQDNQGLTTILDKILLVATVKSGHATRIYQGLLFDKKNQKEVNDAFGLLNMSLLQ